MTSVDASVLQLVRDNHFFKPGKNSKKAAFVKSTDKTDIFAVMKHAVKVLKIILGSKIIPFENDDCDLEHTGR